VRNPATGARSVRGMYLTSDSTIPGRHGLRVGDGFHDYIMFSFVSCLTNNIPRGAYVTGAVLTLRTSRVVGANPVEEFGCCQTRFSVDMVGGSTNALPPPSALAPLPTLPAPNVHACHTVAPLRIVSPHGQCQCLCDLCVSTIIAACACV
jgi:hypothetical protein